MRDKKVRWFIPGIAFIFIIFVIIGLGRDFIADTRKDVDEQNSRYLTELAIQNAQVIKNTVDMQLDKMESIANIIGSQETFSIDFTMDVLEAECRRSSFKRMAYIPPDGNAVTTDHKAFSVLDRAYYEKALEGESNVSDVIVDKVGGGNINVYAVPLYHKGEQNGIIIATSDTDIFSGLLDFRTFYGEGYSYIIEKDGTPVVFSTSSKNAQKFDNFFLELRDSGVDSPEVDKMIRDMEQNDSGIIEYSIDNLPKVGAYRNIGINDWYVVTVVPRDVIYNNADRVVSRSSKSAVIITLLLTGLCILIIVQNYMSDKKLFYLAYVDSFTGGNNLNRFKFLASQILEKNEDNLYMVWIDIDNFKLINDMYGHREGDTILLAMNEMIEAVLPEGDIYGRVENDNFLCLMHCSSEESVLKLGNVFRERFRKFLRQEDKRYTVSLTSGIYKIPPEEKDIEKIIDRATIAHRDAKQMNRERKYSFYTDSMREDAVRVKDIENVMHQALAEGEFQVYLQPKYNMLTGQMEGAEALVRWKRNGKLLSPAEFVPVFEKNGFIANLDLYMLEEVCRMQREWLDMGLSPVPVSVNQSKPLVYGKGYVEKIYKMVKKYSLPPNLIEIELLESLIHENIKALKKILDRLHSFGILICIDDFGSGYSSLNLIKDICADVLKIDREFLNNAETNERAKIVLHNVVELAQGLDMSVVVEGVENEKQAKLLMSVGCCTAQGYLYARPMTVPQYEASLKGSTL